MANKQTVYIFRDEALNSEKSQELQDQWLADNHPDKGIIAGEENDTLLINEERNSLMCMEYIKYEEE